MVKGGWLRNGNPPGDPNSTPGAHDAAMKFLARATSNGNAVESRTLANAP
jgi:hypothetical protein